MGSSDRGWTGQTVLQAEEDLELSLSVESAPSRKTRESERTMSKRDDDRPRRSTIEKNSQDSQKTEQEKTAADPIK
jgi:hypothetical protein